jgi:tetratricopeptide (TPR) repeat protein
MTNRGEALMSDMTEELRHGRIITFYSYKGGTGRTMALANVAWILAANGYRVLVADWDLESPGLHRFLYPFVERVVRDANGIIDLIRNYERVAARSDDDEREKHIAEHARIQRYAFSLKWEFPGEGTLDFLSPGKQDRNYMATLSALDWDTFYGTLKGGEFLDAVREDMRRHYDYVLIDSRTGLSDIADICTVHLPDILVNCFALSTQSIEGAVQTARFISDQHRARAIRILPVPMRVDLAEKEKVEAGRAFAYRLFAGLPAGMSAAQRKAYWASVEVPYQPFYAFEEMLAVFGDEPGAPASLLSSFERLAGYISDGAVTSLPAMDEDLRNRTRQLFVRRPPLESNQITVEFLPEDQVWAEWIAAVLTEGGFTVNEQRLEKPMAEDGGMPAPPRTLTVVSAFYAARRRGQRDRLDPMSRPRHGLAVYVTGTQSLAEFPMASSTFLAGAPQAEAVDRVRKLAGLPPAPEGSRLPGTRYPGTEPRILRVQARNDRFTGREEVLRRLREELCSRGTTANPPIVLHGLGGVGKTQLALEYVHRFRSDYDLVFWLECGQPQFIDTQLGDLGARMEKPFEISAPAGATVEERALLALAALNQTTTTIRWLLVYDNAEDIGAVLPFLPKGGGHILITSQEGSWSDHARLVPVEPFKREESIAHLLEIAPSLTTEEASEVAEAVGDLPLAVAAAAAWLGSTRYPVSRYLRELVMEAPRRLSLSELVDYPRPVPAAWDPSLNLLQERSPAAMRLLELCSVMAPAIALDIIYSPVVAKMLEPFDPALSEPMVMGRVVQQIHRLALIKLDPNANQIQVHRLVQAVVRGRMSAEDLASARRDVQDILVAMRPRRDVGNPAAWSRYALLWPHLPSAEVVSSDQEPVRQLVIDRIRYLWVLSDLDRARDEAYGAISLWNAMLDAKPSPETARSLRRQLLQLQFNLANVLRLQSAFTEAHALDESVLTEQTEYLGADHPHTLMTRGGLAADLRALGRYRQALEMDMQSYSAWTELYGEDHIPTLEAASNLAASFRVTGDVAAAMRLDADTLERFRTAVGTQHPSTLLAARNVVRDLLEAGDYAEAVTRMQDVRRACADALGTDSLATLDAQVLLGIALRSAGQPVRAEPEFQAALAMLTSRYGESHGASLACRLSHSANLLSLDRFAEAEKGIRDVLMEYERRLGPGHPHSLMCSVNLASALRLQSMQAQAMDAIGTALGGLEPTLGGQHPYALAAAMVYGSLLADQGMLEAAEDVEAQTVEALTVTLGHNHPDTLRCQANLLLTRLQRDENVAAQRARVIDQLAQRIGADHPDIGTLRGERRLMRALDPQPF